MSFRDFADKKNSGIKVEFIIDQYRENLLADLSAIVYTNQEKIEKFIAETINLEQLKIFCDSIRYPKSLEFEISIKSKKINKIIEHLEHIENFYCKANKNLDIIKNQIFEYILHIKNKNLESKNIDCIIENRLFDLEKTLLKIESKIKKTNLLEAHKVSLQPQYSSTEYDFSNIDILIDEGKTANFSCQVKNDQFYFNNLTIFTQNERLRSETNLFFEKLQSDKQLDLYKIYYFEWPKEKRKEIDQIKKKISWGIQEQMPRLLVLKEEIPDGTENDIWKIKIKSEKSIETIIWIERMPHE